MKVLQFALIGLGTAAIYAMAAQGIVLVYRGSGILNFASGAMGMIGAELFYQLKDENGVDYKLALVVALLVPAVIGLLMQLVVMRRLRNSTGLARLIATLGLFAGLVGVGLEMFGGEFKVAVSMLPQTSADVFGIFDTGGVGEDRFYPPRDRGRAHRRADARLPLHEVRARDVGGGRERAGDGRARTVAQPDRRGQLVPRRPARRARPRSSSHRSRVARAFSSPTSRSSSSPRSPPRSSGGSRRSR